MSSNLRKYNDLSIFSEVIHHLSFTLSLSLRQFAFVSLFSAFILTCLNFHNLFADKLYTYNNSGSKDVQLHDLFDFDQIY